MFNTLKRWGIKALVFLGFALMFNGTANAALPAGITGDAAAGTVGIFESITTDFQSLMNDYGWPLLLVFIGAFILMDIAKRVIKKVTK